MNQKEWHSQIRVLKRLPTVRLVHCLLVLVSLETASAIYLPWMDETEVNLRLKPVEYTPTKEENQIYRHHETSDFRYDEDILRYLKTCGRQLMIWRCRNAIKPFWNRLTGMVPFIDLYCSVIGNVTTVEWYHRHKKVESGVEQPTGKYERARKAHQERGLLFTAWADFRLRIRNVTRADSGSYRFEVTSPDGGQVDQQFIFVDISKRWSEVNYHTKRKKKKKKKTKKNFGNTV